MESELQISKLDAARRQLETAVRLYFSEADPVSIHTLTAASHEVLTDFNRALGGSPTVMESLEKYVRPEGLEEYKRIINKAANFFKHADRDPEDIQTFNPEQTDFLLFSACSKYRELSRELVPTFAVYTAWFFMRHEPLFDTTRMPIPSLRPAFGDSTRSAFFRNAIGEASILRW